MNKKELVAKLAEKTGETQKVSEKIVNAFVKVVEDELAQGGEIKLIGFGTFKVSQRKARTGVNPKTMKKMKIPAKQTPKCVPGKELKEKVL